MAGVQALSTPAVTRPGSPFPEGRHHLLWGPWLRDVHRLLWREGAGSRAAGPEQAGEETESDEAGPTVFPNRPWPRGTD